MDWERKFSSIVRDTEENLMKVRNIMNGKMNAGVNGDYSLYKYESPHHRKYGMEYTPPRSLHSTQFDRTSPRSLHSTQFDRTSLQLTQYDRAQVSSPMRTHTESDYLVSANQNIVLLQQRLDVQNKTIEQLTSLVQSLETERNQFKLQIDELRSEISQLNSSYVDHRSSNSMKWQIDQMKKDVSQEIDNLRSQLIVLKSKSLYQPYTETSRLISTNFQNIQSDVHEDMCYLRRDLDVLKSRMGCLEHNITAFSTQQDVQRRDFLDKDLERYKPRRIVDTLITLPLAEKRLEATQLGQLRHSVESLKDKIDHVEEKMNTLPPLSSLPPKDYTVSSSDEITSDLSTSYDLEEFAELASPVKQEKPVDKDSVSLSLAELSLDDGDLLDDDDDALDDDLSLSTEVGDFFLD